MADFSEDSQEYLDIYVPIPDSEETQIVQTENETREVALFTKTRNGKVDGAETTPFVLPNHWTYDTLLACVEAYARNVLEEDNITVAQLYYKKAKSKAIVKLSGDTDVPSLLREYPLTYSSGKRRSIATMYLAVDLRRESHTTPRRSPRISSRDIYDIYVHELSTDMKVSSHADILHKVAASSSLQDILVLLKTYQSDHKVYLPGNGLYWVRKGTKQLVSLRGSDDLDACRKEYKGSNSIRVACQAMSTDKGPPVAPGCNRKRQLFEKTPTHSFNKDDNSLWNDTHVVLVRDLEKRGSLWRYGTRHLKLWTDEIMKGNSGGVNEEPEWDAHIDAVGMPPKLKKSSPSTSTASSMPTSTNSMLEFMMFQQQQRMEQEAKRSDMFQTALLACLSPHMSPMARVQQRPLQSFEPPPWTPWTSPASSGSSNTSLQSFIESPSTSRCHSDTQLKDLSVQESCELLGSIGLGKHICSFRENGVDGKILTTMLHPSFGQVMLESMGFSTDEQKQLFDTITDKNNM